MEDLPAGFVVNGPLGESVPSVRDAVDELRRIYCGASGYDFAHVRDPEACLAAKMAYAYRRAFGKDFVIDLIGYRRSKDGGLFSLSDSWLILRTASTKGALLCALCVCSQIV